MRSLKENIINSYYIEHLPVKEIATKQNISSAYVTQVIKQDSRYDEEKENRKNLNHTKRKNAQKDYKRNIREQKRIDDNYSFVQAQHNQAVGELSKGKHLSNESYRKWNYSAYSYNPSKHRYEFDPKLGRSYDVPKFIKER